MVNNYVTYVFVSLLSLVFNTYCFDSSDCVDCGHDFVYCISKQIVRNTSDSEPEFCECSANYPILLDNRFCLPVRHYNQSCFLAKQCRQKDIHSNIGCIRDGQNLLEAHKAIKQIVDSISSISEESDPTARCGCPHNHRYDTERRVCLCEKTFENHKNLNKCFTLNGEEFTVTPLHFAETIVLWVILTLILTFVFMILTIFRKCFCLPNNYGNYRSHCTTATTSTLFDIRLINNFNHRQNSINIFPDRPPTYEEATHV